LSITGSYSQLLHDRQGVIEIYEAKGVNQSSHHHNLNGTLHCLYQLTTTNIRVACENILSASLFNST